MYSAYNGQFKGDPQDCLWQRGHPQLPAVRQSQQWAPADPRLHRGPSSTSSCFGSVSCGADAPSFWVFVHTGFCLCPLSLESLFSPVLWKSCNQILLGFKVRFPGDSQSLCWIPRLGSLMWCSKPSQQWENFFVIIVLQFVGHPPSGFGIWFYCDYAPSPISLKLLLCLWTWVSFFGRFLHSPVTVCSTASCDFGALTGRDEHTSFYSTILNQNSSLLHILRLAFNNLLISTVSAPPGDPCRTLTSCTQTQSLTLSPFPHQGPVSAETCPLFHSGLIWSQVKCTKALIGCSSQVSCL